MLLATGAGLQAMIAGANLFEACVDVPNWRDGESLKAYRVFTRSRNAGHFYRVLSPLSIVVLLAGIALGWSTLGDGRLLAGVALVAAIAAEAMTVAYFFPRNRRLFFEPEEAEPGARSRALVEEWGRANLLRIAVVTTGVASALAALAVD